MIEMFDFVPVIICTWEPGYIKGQELLKIREKVYSPNN